MCRADAGRDKGVPWLVRLAGDWRVQLALGAIALGLAVVVGVTFGRRPSLGGVVPGSMPEAFPIVDSWRAAAAGDDEAYLGCFTREAREALEARLARLGREGFRKELRATAEAALGYEWGRPQPAPDGELRLPVSVFRKDETERLDYVVAKVGAGWLIRQVERRGRQGASPPYGERLGRPGGQGGQE